MRLQVWVVLLVWSLPGTTPAQGGRPESTDALVYGGTSAGVVAAKELASRGRSVVLLAPAGRLGGLSASGLGATDIGNKDAIGGMSRAFYRAVRLHYGSDTAWRFQRRSEFRGWRDEDAHWTFEPHVAEAIFEEWARHPGITLLRNEDIDRQRGVTKVGARITGVHTTAGWLREARLFIDASYEGDLMAAAGVTYSVGRESNDRYGESLNGIQVANSVKHQFAHPVEPWKKPGHPSSGWIFGVDKSPPGQDGAGDRRIQAYNFRVCLTDVPENRVPFQKPDDYDPAWYELLFRTFEAGERRLPWHSIDLPNRKTDTNNNHAVSTDFIGMNTEWPEGSPAVRADLWTLHRRWQEGLLWTLAHHSRVPEEIRNEAVRWGLAQDEFGDNDHWPYALYVREARRMVGSYVMTENDCLGRRTCEDAVGLAAYNMDSHNVRRYIDPAGYVRNEGDIQVPPTRPYPISYRAVVPLRHEASNLGVPVALSASHIAFGSIRMEPVFMILGQSVAIAGDLALSADVPLQDVPYEDLRRHLLEAGQVLAWPR